jgi:hypothetical protein
MTRPVVSPPCFCSVAMIFLCSCWLRRLKDHSTMVEIGRLRLQRTIHDYAESASRRLRNRSSSDGKRGKLQIVFGLPCSATAQPLAIELFPGNAQDTKTFATASERRRRHVCFELCDMRTAGDNHETAMRSPAELDGSPARRQSGRRTLSAIQDCGAAEPSQPRSVVSEFHCSGHIIGPSPCRSRRAPARPPWPPLRVR